MARVYMGRGILGQEIDFASFATIVGGTAVLNISESQNLIELGLSENLIVRIRSEGNVPFVDVTSTPPDESASVRIRIIGEEEEPSAALIERRLRNLRQVYAIAFLLGENREEELGAALEKNPNIDLEELLHVEDRLYLQAASPGSWSVVAFVKTVSAAGQKALNVVSLVFAEGRKLLLDRVRAVTNIKEAEAEKAHAAARLQKVKVHQEEFGLLEKQAKWVIDSMKAAEKKIKDPKKGHAARLRIWENCTALYPKIKNLVPRPEYGK